MLQHQRQIIRVNLVDDEQLDGDGNGNADCIAGHSRNHQIGTVRSRRLTTAAERDGDHGRTARFNYAAAVGQTGG